MARWPLSLLNRRRVLVVADDAVLLTSTRGGAVELELELPFGEESDLDPLIEALRRRRLLPLTIFMDVLQQSYRLEVLPKVGPFDQPRVVARRLDLTYPQTELRAAMRMPGRPEGGGNRLEYLLAALPNSPQIERLLGALQAARVPFSAICLLPIEAMSLVGALADRLPLAPAVPGPAVPGPGSPPLEAQAPEPPPRWTILVSVQRTGGIRQVVVKDGRLALSRLTPDPTLPPHDATDSSARQEPPEKLGDIIAEELVATLGYVSRLGYTPGEGLRIIALCDERTAEGLRGAALPVRDLQCLTPAEAGRRLGLSGVDPDDRGRGDLVFVAWLGRRFYPVMPVLSQDQRQRRHAEWATAAATLLVVGLALSHGYEVADRLLVLHGDRQRVAAQQQELRALRTAYARETQLTGDFPASAAAVVRTIELHEDRVARRPGWGSIVTRLAALETANQQMVGFVWQREPGQDRPRLELSFELAPGRELEVLAAQTESLVAALTVLFPGSSVAVSQYAAEFTADQPLRGGTGVNAAVGIQNLRPLVITVAGIAP